MKITATHKKGNSWFILVLFVSLFLFSGERVLGTEFFSLVNVSNIPDQIDTLPAIAIDKNNKAHIVWNGFYAQAGAPDGVAADAFYTTNKGGSFSTPVKISVPTGWYSRDVTIAVDPSGNVHIAFRRSENQTAVTSEDDIYYVTDELGDLSNPVLLVDGTMFVQDSICSPSSPRIHCDTQGHIHLTFEAQYICGMGGGICYMNNSTGSWGAPVLAATGTWPSEHDSCLDKNGYIHIAFSDEYPPPDYPSRVFYTDNTSGSFSTPTPVTPLERSPSYPNLAVDSQGNTHIVYRDPFYTSHEANIFYVNNIGGSFGPPWPLPDSWPCYLPTVAIDAFDFVHIAYKIFPTWGGALYYGNNSSGDFSFVTYDEMNDYWFPGFGQKYMVLGKNGTMHFSFYDWVGGVYDSDTEIFYLSGSWMNQDDMIGTWDGQGVYYRNTESGKWVKLASPANIIAAGDLGGDGIDDLIGIWPSPAGVWVRSSSTGTWTKLSSTAARHISSGDMNGDSREDMLATWDGSGVFYRNSVSGAWTKMAQPASLIASGDLDGDSIDDLITVFPTSAGVWVKYSKTAKWTKLSSTSARDIASGDMNGDGRDDLVGTWDGSGVYYRNSISGAWVKMAVPADQVTDGEIDGDGTDDLIASWISPPGVYVKSSKTGLWTKLGNPVKDMVTGLMRGGIWGSSRYGFIPLDMPLGGYAEDPTFLTGYEDLTEEGPGGWRFAYQQEGNLVPQEEGERMAGIPGPGDPGFAWTEQKNLIPQERIDIKQTRGRKNTLRKR